MKHTYKWSHIVQRLTTPFYTPLLTFDGTFLHKLSILDFLFLLLFLKGRCYKNQYNMEQLK